MRCSVYALCVIQSLCAFPEPLFYPSVRNPIQQYTGAGQLAIGMGFFCGAGKLMHIALYHKAQADLLRERLPPLSSVMRENLTARTRGAEIARIIDHDQDAFRAFAIAWLLGYTGYHCARAGLHNMGWQQL